MRSQPCICWEWNAVLGPVFIFVFFPPFFNILMEASSRLYERKGRQAETPALGKQCFSEGYYESYNLTKFSKKTSETSGNSGVSKQFLLFQKKMGTEERLKKCDTMTRFQRGNYADAAVKHHLCSPRTKQPNLISLRILLPAWCVTRTFSVMRDGPPLGCWWEWGLSVTRRRWGPAAPGSRAPGRAESAN